MVKIGVVGTPGGWSSELLADTIYRNTNYRLLIDIKKAALDLDSGSAFFEGTDLKALDALIIKKIGAWYSPTLLDRLEILRFLEAGGLKIYSSPESIIRVLDRLSCTITLKSNGIPMPQTTITEDVDAACQAVERYGEAVFKPLYSTKAKGMIVIRSGNRAREHVEAFKNENAVMYIQKKIDRLDQDLGIAFLGGDYMTTYARSKADGAWDTTTRSGGKYAAFDPGPDIIELAHRAQALFNLDFTCVDVAMTDTGPVVFEVSAFGGFRGIATARKIDAAEEFFRYVMRRIRQ